jgi:outer membrane protein TolC
MARCGCFLSFTFVCFCLAQAGGPANAPTVTRLGLKQAIDLALSTGSSPSLATSEMTVRTARRDVNSAKAATALTADFYIDARSLRFDLRSLGLNIPRYPPTNPVQYVGANGPYEVLDPRIKAIKMLIDKNAKRNIQVAKEGVEEANLSLQEEREKIAAETARDYFEVVRTSQIFELEERNNSLAETMQHLTEERYKQKLDPPSAVRQSQMTTNSERQKLSAARLDQTRAVLRLMYLIGQGMGDILKVSDSFEDRPVSKTVEEAIAEALRNNRRLATLRAHDKTLELRDAAVKAQKLPVFLAFGDFGGNVVAPDPSGADAFSHSLTYNATLELKIPVLDGHRRAIERAAIVSESLQQQNEERDMRRQIELEIRLAFADLQQADEQLTLAKQNVEEAGEDLKEAKQNFAAGTISGIDLGQTENRFAIAEDGQNEALYVQARARLSLAQTSGNVSSLEW